MSQEKIIDRIRKVLAIAKDQNGASEQERDTAMKMAHKILVKHNLSMMDVEEAVTSDRHASIFEGYMNNTKRTVFMLMAKLYFCHYFSSNGSKKHYLIGRVDNTITAHEMAKYIIKSIDAQTRKIYNTMDQYERKSYIVSFKHGVMDSINRRVKELIAEASKTEDTPEASASTAVVIQNYYKSEGDANLAHIKNELGITLRTRNARRDFIREDGFNAGRDFGSKINLGRQIA